MVKVLIVCVNPPWPPDSGAPLRSWGWLRTASKVAKIGLVYLTTGREEENRQSELQKYCEIIRMVHIPRNNLYRLYDLFKAMVNNNPYIVQSACSKQMLQEVSQTIAHWKPDIVQAEWIGAAPYLEEARRQNLPTIYSAHNIEHYVTARTPRSLHQRLPPFSSSILQAAETKYASNADLVVSVTEQEKKWFQLHNKRVISIPNCIHPGEYSFTLPSERAKNSVTFVGHLRYPPNIDAARELITSIFPLIQKQLPDVRCIIAGRQPSTDLINIARKNPSVQILGDVKDIRSVWDQASILISPLVSGGGSRIKLLEAAACGVPIIATPFSAKGLALTPERDFTAVSVSVKFAEASVAILREPGRFDALSQQARKTVINNHNWDALTENLRLLYENLAYNHR